MGVQRVAVYGGSFDPIHQAHIAVIGAALQSVDIEEVWVLPCGPRRDKSSLVATPRQRYLMCHLAIEQIFSSETKVRVLDDDIDNEIALPTVELGRMLRNKYKEKEFVFLIGADLAPSLHTWYQSSDLLKECRFLIHPRPGYNQNINNPDIQAVSQWLQPPPGCTTLALTQLSSSEVRTRIALQADTDNPKAAVNAILQTLLPPAVLSFICRYQLYF